MMIIRGGLMSALHAYRCMPVYNQWSTREYLRNLPLHVVYPFTPTNSFSLSKTIIWRVHWSYFSVERVKIMIKIAHNSL